MQTLTLLHSQSFPIGLYADVLTRESISSSRLDSLDQLLIGDASSLRVVLVDPGITNGRRSILPLDKRTAVVGVGLSEQPRWLADDSIYLHLPENPSTGVLLSAVKRAYQFLYQKQRADQLESQLTERTRELQEVAQVGVSLSTVRNHSVLLTMILSKARELSRSDAGSLYLLDEQNGEKVLRWKLAQNDSIDVEGFEEKILPITRKSLAGYVAMTGETLVIDDAYNLPADAEYEINRTFDEQNGYLTRSLLVFPMTNHAGEVIGVLQLINRRRLGVTERLTAKNVPDNVISFLDDTADIMRALASQAAVAVENNLLYESIERLFEASSPRPSPRSNSAIRPPPVTRSASPISPSSWRASSIASTPASSPR
jgi:GAF domain-containing protein